MLETHGDFPPNVLVIPCFNEAGRLDVGAVERFLTENAGWRIVFVDDGSADRTREVVAAIVERGPQCAIDLIALPRNVGKGEAVRLGVVHAIAGGARYVGYWDADLATPLNASLALARELDDDPALLAVLGSRVKLLGRTIERRAARHYLGRVFATAASSTLGLPVYDTQCGAKLFRVCAPVLAAFDTPFRSRWIFDVELIGRLAGGSAGRVSDPRHIREYPLERWTDVSGSKLRWTDWIRASVELLHLFRERSSPESSGNASPSTPIEQAPNTHPSTRHE